VMIRFVAVFWGRLRTKVSDIVFLADLADELGLSLPGCRYRAVQVGANIERSEDGRVFIESEKVSEIRDLILTKAARKKSRVEVPEFLNDFYMEVKDEFRRSGMTQVEFASRCGISQTSAAMILNDDKMISFEMVQKLADGLGMNPVLCLVEKEES